MSIGIYSDEVIGCENLVEMPFHFVGEEEIRNPHPIRTGQRDVFQALTIVFEAVILPLLPKSQLCRVYLRIVNMVFTILIKI